MNWSANLIFYEFFWFFKIIFIRINAINLNFIQIKWFKNWKKMFKKQEKLLKSWNYLSWFF